MSISRSRKKGLSFRAKKQKLGVDVIKEVWSYVFIVLSAALIAFMAVYFFGLCIGTVGASMEPTLRSGQKVFVDRLSYTLSKPKSGDVLVFQPNGNPSAHFYIKRVVAVPGDVLEIKEGVLYVNGKVFTGDIEYDKIAYAGILSEEVKLAKGEFFVLGDNVNGSEDSRSAGIGAIAAEDIVGKVWFRLHKGDFGMGFV